MEEFSRRSRIPPTGSESRGRKRLDITMNGGRVGNCWRLIVFFSFISVSSSTLFSEREHERGPISNLDMMDDHHGDGFHGSVLGHSDSEHHLQGQGLCEPIKIGMCMELGYNQTTMPNLVGHDAQGDADQLLQTFTPLIQYGCSPNLKLFLCSAHVPMCTDKVPQPIGPCRSLCESVRRKCEPILNEFGFKWPLPLNCSKFHPENNHQHMCIPDPTASSSGDYPSTSNGGGFGGFPPHSDIPRTPGNFKVTTPNHAPGSVVTVLRRLPAPPPGIPTPTDSPIPGGFYFPPSISKSSGSERGQQPDERPKSKIDQFDSTIDSGEGHAHASECTSSRKIWSRGSCWIKCGSSTGSEEPGLFHPSERAFARNYALLWAILSLSAAVIALTLSVCSPKLSTAERPILYIALCQILFSVGVIVGSSGSVSCFTDKGTGMELLASGPNVPSSCSVVFLLTYFFGMAATLWRFGQCVYVGLPNLNERKQIFKLYIGIENFGKLTEQHFNYIARKTEGWVILCLSWLLSLSPDLCLSLQQKEWSMFHLCTWGISSILTSTALIHKAVDADELTGLCGVGFQSTTSLTYYHLIPLSVGLSLGLLFFAVGLFRRIFPEWKQLCFRFGQARTKSIASGGVNPPHNCERDRDLGHDRSRFGYTPVLVSSPSGGCCAQCHHPATGACCSSQNGRQSGGQGQGSNPLHFSSSSGAQRLRALENSKAVWMRVGIFALVHSLPIACQVGTMVYELHSRQEWEIGKQRPNLQIFLLRLNMNLIAGLTAGVWVLSTYSWKSFSSILRRIGCCFPTRQHGSQDKIQRRGSLVTTTTTAEPLLPPIVGGNVPPSQNRVGLGPSPPAVLTSFQPGCHVVTRDNFAAILPMHHNYPLPRLPTLPTTNTSATTTTAGRSDLPPRTDAWRRGETIV